MVRNLLEICCGTKSIGKVFERNGWNVISLDIDQKWCPTICSDILSWDYKSAYPPFYFDYIWASPPCQTFSTGRNIMINKKGWSRERIYNDMVNIGLPPVQRTLEIIRYFKPKCFTIENPQSGKLKNFLDLPYSDCSYCQYGLPYRKNTRLWNNIKLKLEKCKCKGIHQASVMGNKNTPRDVQERRQKTEELYIIPPLLVESIYEQVMEHLESEIKK